MTPGKACTSGIHGSITGAQKAKKQKNDQKSMAQRPRSLCYGYARATAALLTLLWAVEHAMGVSSIREPHPASKSRPKHNGGQKCTVVQSSAVFEQGTEVGPEVQCRHATLADLRAWRSDSWFFSLKTCSCEVSVMLLRGVLYRSPNGYQHHVEA